MVSQTPVSCECHENLETICRRGAAVTEEEEERSSLCLGHQEGEGILLMR